jgi:FkbM family methyltransferase
MKEHIQKIINRFGYKVIKYPDEGQRRKIKLLELNRINLVIDIGANQGQYASDLRTFGFKGKIISFEPLTSAFEILKKKSEGDSSWEVINSAIGDKDEDSIINISSNSFSSSILDMHENHITDADKNVYYTGTESIKIKRLDSIFDQYVNSSRDTIFLKIDAQGYEDKILAGAKDCLQYIKGLQIEMPLIELYKGQTLFYPLLQNLYNLGFKLQGLEQGFHHPDTLELYEMDGIFFKNIR